jgi:CRP-like cAMP-binding protein
MQAPGSAQRISPAHLRKAMDQSARLHRSLLRCVHAFLIQTAQTAVANGRSKLEERLARWLLMANDRIDGPEVPLTHRFLAVMLGVHRPFVTLTVQALERKGLIRAGRQVITIIDRKGLIKLSDGAYLPPA